MNVTTDPETLISASDESFSKREGRVMNGRNRPGIGWRAALVALAVWAGTASAQSSATPAKASGIAPLTGDPFAMMDSEVVPASCSSCSSLPPTQMAPGVYGYGKYYAPSCGATGCGGCGTEGCGENGCVPGRQACETCEGSCRATKLFCAFHNALCCPDPCYEPRFSCGANAALFVDYARPVTQTRFRWDSGRNLVQPDRSEYFWAATGKKGPKLPESRVNYNELTLYQEVGIDRFSFYIVQPYRNMNGAVNGGSGGFGDLTLGTKTMILDSEVLQTTFQFQTNIPTGNPGNGTGVGHVSLTPSLLTAIKLYPDTYFQSQLGYWIPISPTTVNGSAFAGGVFQFNQSINHVLCRPLNDTSLVVSIESMGYTFTSGKYTGLNGAILSANDQTYFSVGPGFRLCMCDKGDIGFGMQFAVTNPHFADQLYRTEFRWRF